MSLKDKFKKIATPELKAYADILENIITTGIQIKNTANDMITRNSGGDEKKMEAYKKDFEPVIVPILSQVEDTQVIFEEIQKEIDARMMKDLGLKNGIRRMQSHILKFEDQLAKLADKEVEKRKREMSSMNIITEDEIRPKPIFKLD